jgi:hypothetical protein
MNLTNIALSELVLVVSTQKVRSIMQLEGFILKIKYILKLAGSK